MRTPATQKTSKRRCEERSILRDAHYAAPRATWNLPIIRTEKDPSRSSTISIAPCAVLFTTAVSATGGSFISRRSILVRRRSNNKHYASAHGSRRRKLNTSTTGRLDDLVQFMKKYEKLKNDGLRDNEIARKLCVQPATLQERLREYKRQQKRTGA